MQLMNVLAPFFGTGQLNDAAVIMHVLRDGFGVKNPQNFIGPLAGMLPMPAPPEGEEPPSDEEEEAPPNSSGTDAVPPEVLAQLQGQVGYSANTLGVNGGGAMGPGMPQPAQ
jgi:hypothetical protein